MSYYRQKQSIAHVNTDDRILDQVEKWEAHEKGILHRAFTVILTHVGQVILQQRKHPAFDKVLDMTFSSHQLYYNNVLQNDLEAITDSLKREWNLEKKDLVTSPKMLGKIYYQAKDPNSIYTEHEVDYIYEVELRKLPVPNPEFAYGFDLIPKKNLKSNILKSYDPKVFPPYPLAPWVKKIIEKFI